MLLLEILAQVGCQWIAALQFIDSSESKKTEAVIYTVSSGIHKQSSFQPIPKAKPKGRRRIVAEITFSKLKVNNRGRRVKWLQDICVTLGCYDYSTSKEPPSGDETNPRWRWGRQTRHG